MKKTTAKTPRKAETGNRRPETGNRYHRRNAENAKKQNFFQPRKTQTTRKTEGQTVCPQMTQRDADQKLENKMGNTESRKQKPGLIRR
jgi:hypothetical protein